MHGVNAPEFIPGAHKTLLSDCNGNVDMDRLRVSIETPSLIIDIKLQVTIAVSTVDPKSSLFLFRIICK